MSPRSSAQQYKGLDAHLHVTISEKQNRKVRKAARRAGLSLSKYMRKVIDEIEVSK